MKKQILLFLVAALASTMALAEDSPEIKLPTPPPAPATTPAETPATAPAGQSGTVSKKHAKGHKKGHKKKKAPAEAAPASPNP